MTTTKWVWASRAFTVPCALLPLIGGPEPVRGQDAGRFDAEVERLAEGRGQMGRP